MSGSAGFPDFGLFTDVQSARGGVAAVWAAGGPVPERGVVEADDIPASLSIKRSSAQVTNYLTAYGLVLITNYRDFELLEADAASATPKVVETFTFGREEAIFFTWAAGRRGQADAAIALSFVEFLRRPLSRRAPLAAPRAAAALRAPSARDALARVPGSSGVPPLGARMDAVGESLSRRVH